MKIGQLLKFIPQYPTMGGSSPTDSERIVILIDKDFIGFKSEVLIDDQKHWVKNSDLYELVLSELISPDEMEEDIEEDWFDG